MLKLWNWLQGKKTYIIMGASIAWAVSSVILGKMEAQEAIGVILAALGMGGLRAGMK